MNNKAKKQYSKISKALFFFVTLFLVIEVLIVVLYIRNNNVNHLTSNNLLMWIINDIPQFLSAFIVYVLLIRKYKKEKVKKSPLSINSFFTYLAVGFGVIYIGNIIGVILSTIISFVFSHKIASNPVTNAVSNNNILITFIFVVVIAPIFEEFVFRKVIIDRTSKYGEKQAIIFSALSFSLFHMNLYQTFYAFGIGLVFGYVYTRTRDVKYTILMHSIINFVGGIILPSLSSVLLQTVSFSMAGNPLIDSIISSVIKCVIVLLFIRAYTGVAIIGIYLFFTKVGKLEFKVKKNQILKDDTLKTCYLNAFYIIFAIVCLSVTIIQLF